MRTPLRCLGVAAILTAAAAQQAAAQQAGAAEGSGRDVPQARNVVVLFSDDAGWADFGFMPYADAALAERTPRIDSIARDGVRFTGAYMSGCVCSPSRAGLLTGRYQQRFGHETNIPPAYMGGGMDLDERTVADRLGARDLATGLVGKWHLGYPAEYHPNERGFDWFHGLIQGSRSYFPIENVSPHRVIQENGEPLPEVGYVTDRFGKAAAEFIGEHAGEPFFLFVSFTAPHGPLQPKAEDLAGLDDVRGKRRRRYAGLVVGLDRAVGRVLDALDTHELRDDTLVVFTNDNGGQTRVGADNGPLRGRKGQLWEGGIRVPMAVRWPGVIEPGTTIDDPVSALDLLPTFLAATGGTLDPAWQLDGRDLGPRLAGGEPLPERPLFWRSFGSRGPAAMRQGHWKLLVQRGTEVDAARNRREEPEDDAAKHAETVHLFDLAADLGEQRNLAAEHPERVAAMRERLTAWEEQLEEPRWGTRRARRRR